MKGEDHRYKILAQDDGEKKNKTLETDDDDD